MVPAFGTMTFTELSTGKTTTLVFSKTRRASRLMITSRARNEP